jgi:hypothetical protein
MNKNLLFLLLAAFVLPFSACNTGTEEGDGEGEGEGDAVTAESLVSACWECTQESDSDDIEACIKEFADKHGETITADKELADGFHDGIVAAYISFECDCYNLGDYNDIEECIEDDMWNWDYTLVDALEYEGLIDGDDFWDDYYDGLDETCADAQDAYNDQSDMYFAAEEICWCMEDFMDGYYDATETEECMMDAIDWYGEDVIDMVYDMGLVEDECGEAVEYYNSSF